MATIIKLVVALLVVTAATQAGRAAFNNYQFQDAVQQALLFAPRASDAEVTQQVITLAGDYGLAVDAENISVREVGADRVVECTYTTEVAFVPGVFSRPMTFNPSTSVRMLNPPRKR